MDQVDQVNYAAANSAAQNQAFDDELNRRMQEEAAQAAQKLPAAVTPIEQMSQAPLIQ